MTIKHLFPPSKPVLDLNFADERELDPRIKFTRSTTATYVDNRGIVRTAQVDEPRFDFDGGTGESLGLLVEESRTNYLCSYMAFGVNKNNAVFSNYSDARFGSESNAFSYTFPGGVGVNGELALANPGNISTPGNGIQYTLSGWIKANQAYTLAGLLRDERRQDASYAFDLTTEWQYFSSSTPAGITDDGSGTMYLRLQNDAVIDIPAGLKIDFACMNLEVGGFPTSFIKTDPAAPNTAVTRPADVATIDDISSFFNQIEGTLFSDYNSLNPGGSTQQRVFQFMGINSNYVRGFKVFNNQSSFNVIDGVQLFNKALPVGQKNAGAYRQDDYGFASDNNFVDGITAAGTLSTPMTRCWLNASMAGGGRHVFVFSGHIARLAYWPRRLTDEQLEALTL